MQSAEGGHVKESYNDIVHAQLLEQQAIEARKKILTQGHGEMELSKQVQSELGAMVWGSNEGSSSLLSPSRCPIPWDGCPVLP